MITASACVDVSAPRMHELLSAFLSAYWLRPENAVWMALRSAVLSTADDGGIGLDLGCGDGLFSFIHAGGRLDANFDVFASVGHLDAVKERHADMFDHFHSGYEPVVVEPAARSISVGTDHKRALLNKAAKLNLYGTLLLQDHNQSLSFEAGQFDCIYCNTLYWVRAVDAFLEEIGRVCRPGGRFIAQVKLSTIKQCTLSAHRDQLGDRLLTLLGRGRFDTWPTLTDRTTWERRFMNAGFDIQDVQPVATASLAHVWDVGLRPIAPLLVKMANSLASGTRAAIKTEWVALLMEMLLPLCSPTLELTRNGGEPVELQYVLTPR